MINKKVQITILVLVFVFSEAMTTTAQNGTYKAKISNKENYTIDSFYVQKQTSVVATEVWADGNSSTVTIRANLNFTIQLCGYSNIPNTNMTIPEVIYTINGNSTSCGKNSLPDLLSSTYYINQVYNDAYYQNLATQNSTLYQLSGNDFTYNSTYSYVANGGSYGWDLITLNTKTGWLVKIEEKDFYLGSMDSHVIISEVPSKNSSTPGFELVSIIGLFAILVPVILLKKKKTNI